MVNTLVNFFVFRLIWPPYQADMAPYQANTHRYQAVSWRRETTLIQMHCKVTKFIGDFQIISPKRHAKRHAGKYAVCQHS